MDEPESQEVLAAIDPLTYGDRLARIPKFVILSSDDEFMMFDWSNIWYDELQRYGETHLMIAHNSEHSLATGMVEVLTAISSFVRSVAAGKSI